MKSSVHRPAPLPSARQPLRLAATKVAWVGVLTGSGVRRILRHHHWLTVPYRASLLASLGPESSAPRHKSDKHDNGEHDKIGSQVSRRRPILDGRYDAASRTISAARRLNIHCHGHALNRRQTGTAAPPHSKKPRGRYTARLLKRLPICAVPPLFPQSTKPEMVASKRNKIGRGAVSPVAPLEGWPCRNPAAKIDAAAVGAAVRNAGRPTMPIVTWDHVHLRSPDPGGDGGLA